MESNGVSGASGKLKSNLMSGYMRLHARSERLAERIAARREITVILSLHEEHTMLMTCALMVATNIVFWLGITCLVFSRNNVSREA